MLKNKEPSVFDINKEQLRLQELIDSLIKLGKHKGAHQVEVSASTGIGFSTTVRMGKVDTLEHHQNKGMSITVYLGKKKGSASTSDLQETSLLDTLDKAINIAKFTEEDDCNGLPEVEFLALAYPDLDLYHPYPIVPEQIIDDLVQMEQLGLSYDKRLFNSEGASFASSESLSILGNSHGFLGVVKSTRYDRSLCLIGRGKDSMERDYDYTVSRLYSKLDHLKQTAEITAKKTLARLNPQKIQTGEYSVIFHADIASGLLNSFMNAIRGGNLYRRTSFLLDSIGLQVFPDFVNFYENPLIPQALGSSPFDGEGVITKPQAIVEKGEVKRYILSSYSARKLGMKTTGNAGGLHNVEISTQNIDLKGLLQKMGKGILVTEVMGQGINIVTGDYSRGATGFWVENGEIQYPVSEFTLSGNLKDMYKNIIAIGSDIEKRSIIQTGSILLEKMMIAGNS